MRGGALINLRPTGLVLSPAVHYFSIVFGVGFLLGSVRVPFLVPRIGERIAELAEMPFMLLAIFIAAGYVVRKYGASDARPRWLVVGSVALVLLVTSELVLAVVLAGRSIGEYLASRDPMSGSVYLVMLVIYAVMPWLRRGQARSPVER